MARPEKWEDRFIDVARSVCKLGATDAELADILGVCARTVQYWKNTQEGFADALKAGKEEADNRVTRSLYHRAVGYDQEATKIFMNSATGQPVIVPYIEAVQPDTTAAIFWLKNRRPEEWRDKQVIEGPGKDGAHLIEAIDMTPTEVARRLAFILKRAEEEGQ